MSFVKILGSAVLGLALVGCSSVKEPTVTGSITYLDRMALPEKAVVTVTLGDVAKQDVSLTAIAHTQFKAAGKQVPFTYVLPYDANDIGPASRIIVNARVELDGNLIYVTDEVHEVITNGVNTADIVLKRVQN